MDPTQRLRRSSNREIEEWRAAVERMYKAIHQARANLAAAEADLARLRKTWPTMGRVP